MQKVWIKLNQRLWFWMLMVVLSFGNTAFGQTPVGTLIISDATVSYTDAGLAEFSLTSEAITTSVLGSAWLSITIVADRRFIAPNNTTRWTIEVRNGGNITATGVTLKDILIGPVQIIEASDDGIISGNQVDWTDPFDLGPGESIFRTVVIRANEDAPVGITVSSRVLASASNIEDVVQSEAEIKVGSAPALLLVKRANREYAAPGETLTYTLTYTNQGNAIASQPRLNDQLSQQLLFISADPTPTQILGNVLTWVLEDVPPNSSGNIELTAQIKPTVPGETKIHNKITAATVVPNLAGKPVVYTSESLPSTVAVQVQPMTLSKTVETAQDTLRPDSEITYLLTVGNLDGQAVPVVTLVDTIQDVLTLESIDTDAKIEINGQMLHVQWAPFPANSEVTVRVTARVRSLNSMPSSVGNRAWLTTPNITLTAEAPLVFLQSKFDGQLTQSERIIPGEMITITLNDFDLNIDPSKVESIRIPTVNVSTGEQETSLLIETASNTGIFTGQISTFFGEEPGSNNDGLLLVQGGNVIRSVYTDTSTVLGAPLERIAETLVNSTLISLDPVPRTLVANGNDQAILTALVTDDRGNPLPDGTPVQISADKGTFENGTGQIIVPVSGGNGEAATFYIAPLLANSDTARVLASFGGIDSDIVGLEVLPGAIGVRVFDQNRQTEIGADDRNLNVNLTLVGTTVVGDSITLNVTIDKNRLFVVPDIPPGNYELRALVTNKGSGEIISNGVLQQVIVKPDGSTTPPKNAISGTLRGSNESSGTRYAGSTVDLLNDRGEVIGTTTLDEEGRYDFQDLPADSYTLRAQFADGSSTIAAVSSRSQLIGAIIVNADILINPFGIIFDADTGTVVPGATVSLELPSGEALQIPTLDGTGASPNLHNINPFISAADGHYAFLFGADQIGADNNPVSYFMSVTPPPGSSFKPRRLLLTVRPSRDDLADQGSLDLQIASGDGLGIAVSNSFTLTPDPVDLSNIKTVAFNIPLFTFVPVISFTKTATQPTAITGNSVDFRLIVSNVGNDTVRSITVRDTLSTAWQVLEVEGGNVVDSNIAQWELGNLPPGHRDTLGLKAMATRPNSGRETLTNRAWVQADGILPVRSETEVIVRAPLNLNLSKQVNAATAVPGDNLVYTLILNYQDSVKTLGSITITDSLPTTVIFVSATGNPTVNENVLTWLFGELAPHQSDTLSVITRVVTEDQPIINVAQVEQNGQILTSSNAVTTTVQIVPDLWLTKNADRTVAQAGERITYQLTVGSNNNTLGTITVRDTLPPELIPVEGSSQASDLPSEFARSKDVGGEVSTVEAGAVMDIFETIRQQVPNGDGAQAIVGAEVLKRNSVDHKITGFRHSGRQFQ